MLTIYKLRADHVVDFAAEELKKYLRMMMPRCGEIDIVYDPQATQGFRLGLLEDHGLSNEAKDPVLDDIVHIDTDTEGGILAGSNSRSVLFAVYRYLKLNGCRWLYPGVDGEHIPMQNITPQKYHHWASHRFRGHCNEGAENQSCMLETIDFYAKQELNVYMIEFDNPFHYYNRYYTHLRNTTRASEPVPTRQTLQWKRQCEAEIAKRGLQFHDMGHGWTAEPFGLDSSDGWTPHFDREPTPEQQSYMAEVNGTRGLHNGVALNTNLCMSKPKVRNIMVESIVSYAKLNRNVSYLHVWLADGFRNHCECQECRKLYPSDYYLMIMNELDDRLTEEGLDTRIVFIAYLDTLWAPLQETIRNTKRFSLLYAPIQRSYTASVSRDKLPEPLPYIRNDWETPTTADIHLSLLRVWQKNWQGPTFGYEYHFWRHQYADPSQMHMARRVYEDIHSLDYIGLDGYVEDGSQRSFYPNGFAMHVYAEALLNLDLTFDEILEDYFSHAYGEDWPQVKAFLDKVADCFDFAYMLGKDPAPDRPDPEDLYYNPAHAEALASVKEAAVAARELAQAHAVMPTRPQVISWRLLQYHTDYVESLGQIMADKCVGNTAPATDMLNALNQRFGVREHELERYLDHMLAFGTLSFKVQGYNRVL